MRSHLISLLVVMFTLMSVGLHAQRQGQALVDSLEKQMGNVQLSENEKVDIMTTLCFEYREILPAKGIEYGIGADSIARQISYNAKLGEIYLGLCYCYTFYDDISKTYEYGLKAVKYNRAYKNDNVGLISEIINYTHDPALDGKRQKELFDSCLHRLNTCRDTTWYIKTVGGLGNCYKEIGDYKRGDSLIRIALDLARKTNRQFLVYHNLERVGEIFYHYNQFDSAISTFQNVDAYLVGIGDRRLRSECEHLLARSLLVTYRNSGDHARLIDAKKHAIESYELSAQIGYALQKLLDYATLKEIAVEQGDKDTANFYLEKYQVLNDSLYGQNAIARLEKITIAKIDEVAANELKIKDVKLQKQKEVDRYFLAIVILSVAFSAMVFRNYRKQKNTNSLLSKEKQKSEQLLLNILPSEVAEELKEKGSAKAQHYDNVTVLFTDFVDFTDAGERMDPQGLIDELHACFKVFDEIMGKYNIEKIKTIGDAYLAVAGLPSPDPRHAEHVVMAAREISAFMQDRLAKLGDTTFEIRIGIHSGSVVAGIVGVRKFAYDIWGDTVNTAARMEQNSESGKINISQTTYELVKDKFTCEYRGEIDAKGKGHLKMYYVA